MASPRVGKALAARAPFVAVLAILGLVLLLHLAGLFLFTSGFLLQRVELNAINTCTKAPSATWQAPSPPPWAAHGNETALDAWDAVLDAHAECSLPPRFRRTVLWIIDALRYDFIADAPDSPPLAMPNPFIHNWIRTPATYTNTTPRSSFLAHFVADPPTTTLQRLKGLTTGSLPTFIEAGANFGGSGRVLEDTWIAQLRARKAPQERLSFVGDDTWQMVFANLFDEAHPYSSFNVEDLDTVDAGVESHMLRAMDQDDWTLIVAHSLGVDHVGHRFGPAHARMPPKLEQMERLIQDVLHKLRDDTLFVLLGDHGMDATGDHGGDSELEIGSGLWMYANTPFDPAARSLFGSASSPSTTSLTEHPDVTALLRDTPTSTPSFQPFSLLPIAPFEQGHRSLPQIDLVPTLALLMGVPIPFNNLGTVMPELFASDTQPLQSASSRLLRALRINARQIKTYLDAYAKHSADLKPFSAELRHAWLTALQADAVFAEHATHDHARKTAQAYMAFTRLALARAQSVWAQFEYVRMGLGIAVLASSLVVTWLLWHRAFSSTTAALARMTWQASWLGCVYGGVAGLFLSLTLRISTLEGQLAGIALGTACTLTWHLRPGHMAIDAFPVLRSKSFVSHVAAGVILGCHAMLYASNSFTMWEDRITLGMLTAILLARAWAGLGAPLTRWQLRIPIMAVIALVLVRVASMSRVCREEQAPYCTPSFYAYHATTDFADNPAYALSGPATNSPYALLAAYVVAFGIADVLRQALMPSRAHLSTASTLLTWVIRPAMLGAAGFWLADWVHGLDRWDEPTRATFFVVKMWVARVVLVVLLCGSVYWYLSPLSLSVLHERPAPGAQARVLLLGFGNTFGAAFLLAMSLIFAYLFLLSQPMGQLALTACFVALLLLAELGDHERDARLLAASKLAEATKTKEVTSTRHGPSFLDVVCVALLGFVAFFGTGHQATFSSIQWRVAFVGFSTVTYPWSPLFVILNAFGPLCVLPAFGVVLLTLWNLAPTRERPDEERPPPMRLPCDILRSALALLLYAGTLTLSAATWAWFFRRHLMLFKIWVPRYMTAGLGLLVTDVALLGAVLTAWCIASHTSRAFGTLYS